MVHETLSLYAFLCFFFFRVSVIAIFGINFESLDFILAALFLWIICFLDSLSIIFVAFTIFSDDGFLTKSFKTFLRRFRNLLFWISLFLSCLNFLEALFITGTALF